MQEPLPHEAMEEAQLGSVHSLASKVLPPQDPSTLVACRAVMEMPFRVVFPSLAQEKVAT